MAVLFAPEIQMELPFDRLHQNRFPVTDGLYFALVRATRVQFASPIKRLTSRVLTQVIKNGGFSQDIVIRGKDPLHLRALVCNVDTQQGRKVWRMMLVLPIDEKAYDGVRTSFCNELLKVVVFPGAFSLGGYIYVAVPFEDFVRCEFDLAEGGFKKEMYALREDVPELVASARARKIPFLVKEGVAA